MNGWEFYSVKWIDGNSTPYGWEFSSMDGNSTPSRNFLTLLKKLTKQFSLIKWQKYVFFSLAKLQIWYFRCICCNTFLNLFYCYIQFPHKKIQIDYHHFNIYLKYWRCNSLQKILLSKHTTKLNYKVPNLRLI